MRPVYHGMISYLDLKSGDLTLEDILLMNVYIDNQKYNEFVLEKERSHE
jgi:hypothetical protein|nr:MAG TPA: hypothetical protein [Caudoviricetes sp.]